MNIGEKIKLLRKEKGLTQKQLAELIHKSEITVRKYEANDISLTVDVFIDILNVLDSKLIIETNDNCDNLLRQYIDSLNLYMTDEKYKEIESFIKQYITFSCSSTLEGEMMCQNMSRVNRTKK